MVFGNGLLAGRFRSYENDHRYLIFAAGVSNSTNKNSEQFQREAGTLKKCIQENPEKKLVYFSTYSVYDPGQQNSVYVQHKLNMEKLAETNPGGYYILRVSNVAGKSDNPNTVLNYFYNHIRDHIHFDLWVNACRNILDIDDLFFIADRLLNNGQSYTKPVNIAAPVNYTVMEILNRIEKFLGVKANYTEVKKGNCFEIDLTDIKSILQDCHGRFDDNYLNSILSKYFKF